jgi:hypothetical protein
MNDTYTPSMSVMITVPGRCLRPRIRLQQGGTYDYDLYAPQPGLFNANTTFVVFVYRERDVLYDELA